MKAYIFWRFIPESANLFLHNSKEENDDENETS